MFQFLAISRVLKIHKLYEKKRNVSIMTILTLNSGIVLFQIFCPFLHIYVFVLLYNNCTLLCNSQISV